MSCCSWLGGCLGDVRRNTFLKPNDPLDIKSFVLITYSMLFPFQTLREVKLEEELSHYSTILGWLSLPLSITFSDEQNPCPNNCQSQQQLIKAPNHLLCCSVPGHYNSYWHISSWDTSCPSNVRTQQTKYTPTSKQPLPVSRLLCDIPFQRLLSASSTQLLGCYGVLLCHDARGHPSPFKTYKYTYTLGGMNGVCWQQQINE